MQAVADLEALGNKANFLSDGLPTSSTYLRNSVLNRKLVELLEGPEPPAPRMQKAISLLVQIIECWWGTEDKWPRDERITSVGVPVEEAYQKLQAKGVFSPDVSVARTQLDGLFNDGRFELPQGCRYSTRIITRDGTAVIKADRMYRL